MHLAHPIGGFYDANHGSVNAVLLPEVLRYDLPVVTKKLPELAWGLGHFTKGEPNRSAEMVQDTVEALLDAIGAPGSLRSIGVVQGRPARSRTQGTERYMHNNLAASCG